MGAVSPLPASSHVKDDADVRSFRNAPISSVKTNGIKSLPSGQAAPRRPPTTWGPKRAVARPTRPSSPTPAGSCGQ